MQKSRLTASQRDSEPLKTAIYVRISQDTLGEGLGVGRQERACRELADRLGWHVVEVYVDNDISAFQNQRKKREAYQRLLADIADGRINGLIAWAADRLHRQMRELVPFIDLVNEHHVQIQTVTGGRVDLSTAQGKLVASTLGSIAQFESDHKQERIRAKIDELVRDGKVHNGGRRPFGYTRIYQGEGPGRKIVRDEVCETEAVLIREARDRIFAGSSVYAVVKDFNERGIRTSSDLLWSTQAMKTMLISGRIAGLKEHRRQVVGPASWPAIVSPEDREQLIAILNAPSRSTHRKPYRSYWLSGAVVCSNCQLVMRINKRTDNGKYAYRCMPKGMGGCGGMAINYSDLDQFMRRLVIKRLSDPEFLQELASAEADTKSESAVIMKGIERDERRLTLLEAQLKDEFGDPEDIPELAASVRATRRRISAHRDSLARLVDAAPLVGIDVAELNERWESLEVGQRAGLLRVAKVGRILIHRSTVRGRFDPGRIEIEPTQS